MENFNLILDQLNFHDSDIISVNLDETRCLNVLIDYYNWEGNELHTETWKYKKLILKVEYCLHLRFNSPSLNGFETEIRSHEHMDLFDAIKTEIPNYISQLKVDKIDNVVAIRFLTQSFGEAIFGETNGFLEIAGLNASITWQERGGLGSPKHISVVG